MGNGISRSLGLLLLLALASGSLGTGQCNNIIFVSNGQSIQDAVDAATPGTTIIVKRGLYTAPADGRRAVVDIMKDDITLIGKRGSVIDATGLDYGIAVGEKPSGVCLAGLVNGFKMVGFTIQNAGNSGAYVANVNDYEMIKGRYLDNKEYGPYPVCSTNGLVAHNYASGHDDAAVYIGQGRDTVIEYNTAVNSVIGIEVENTNNTVVRHNTLRDNTAGVLVVVLPGLDLTEAVNTVIEHNVIQNNNKENTGGGFLTQLPVGSGILNVGGDELTIRNNVLEFNDTYGIASIGNVFFLFDSRIEPFVDDMVVENNTVLHNGDNPDPISGTPGVDIVWVPDVVDPATGTVLAVDPDPSDNCFANNQYDSDFPEGIVAAFPCP